MNLYKLKYDGPDKSYPEGFFAADCRDAAIFFYFKAFDLYTGKFKDFIEEDYKTRNQGITCSLADEESFVKILEDLWEPMPPNTSLLTVDEFLKHGLTKNKEQ